MTGEKVQQRKGQSAENRQLSENSADIDRGRIVFQDGHDAPQLQAGAIETSQSRTSDYFQNILNGSGVPLLVVDRDIRLCFFTPAVTTLFDVTAANLGYPLAVRFRVALATMILFSMHKQIVATNGSLWREVDSDAGGCFARRLLPYRGEGNVNQGVIITFVDISDKRQAEREREAILAYSNSVIDTVRQSPCSSRRGIARYLRQSNVLSQLFNCARRRGRKISAGSPPRPLF